MNSLEAQRAIIEKTNETIALARRLYPTYTHSAPAIRFDIRGRSVGGSATGHYKLSFNLDWYNANPAEYLKNTVTHEVAHIVASATGLGRGHNAGWVRICLALGGDGQRCNNHEDVKAVPKARRTTEHLYLTDRGQEIWIGPVHHKRLQQRGGFIDGTRKCFYSLTNREKGKIYKEGYQGRHRVKA